MTVVLSSLLATEPLVAAGGKTLVYCRRRSPCSLPLRSQGPFYVAHPPRNTARFFGHVDGERPRLARRRSARRRRKTDGQKVQKSSEDWHGEGREHTARQV